MPDFDARLVDSTVTYDEIAQAHDGDPTEFPLVDAQDDVDDTSADGPDVARGLVAIVPRTPAAAIVNLRSVRDRHVHLGVGVCLQHVRRDAWGVPAVWPNANVAAQHAAPDHKYADFSKIPRGITVFFPNPHLGHVVDSLGGGLCDTTDFHELGFSGVALITRVAAWCGATSVFAGEVVNGFDVWPDPKKPHKPAAPWSLVERRAFIHRRLEAAESNHNEANVRQLKAWQARMDARIAKASK